MQLNATNARAFAESGSVGSNIIRRVEVWGVDPNYTASNGISVPLALCRDSTGYTYQVFLMSAVGGSQPQVGETWLISRALGLWTFMALLLVPSPIVQTVTGSYKMQPCNRYVFGSVPNGQNWTVTFPNPITAIQGATYGFRNTSGGGTGYDGVLALAPFNNETIHGPSGFGAHSGGTFVCDNVGWYCVGDTTAAGGANIG
jgi:hypothetical protein